MSPKETKEINKLRELFPSEIAVSVERSDNGDFLATINTFKGLFTEGRNFSGLMEMVNDAVKTYFEIPEKYIPYMPNYVPPLAVAQQLDIFPVIESKQDFSLPLSTTSEKTCR